MELCRYTLCWLKSGSYLGTVPKKDEEGLAAQYEFSRILTFIVMQNGLEVGRIVERPLVSLEKDLVDILK